MKPRILWFALLATSPLVAQEPPADPPAPTPMPSGAVEVNGIAAIVNGRVITKNKLGFMLAPIFSQLAAQFPRRGPEFERQVLEARDQTLQELIDREIILSEFAQLQKKGANLPEHVVDQEIRRQIRETHNGSQERFEEELKRARMSTPAYRKMVREQLIVQAMRAEHFADAPPPLESEITKEYQEVKDTLRDTTKDEITFHKIFLPRIDAENPLADADSQLALAEQIVDQVKRGADFAELAKKHSRDAYASEGGYQENVPRTDLAPEFAAIIFAGKDGDILGPLEDPAGFTIVKIGRIKKGPAPPLSEVREMIEQRVTRKKNAAAYEKWIANKRKSASITIKLK